MSDISVAKIQRWAALHRGVPPGGNTAQPRRTDSHAEGHRII